MRMLDDTNTDYKEEDDNNYEDDNEDQYCKLCAGFRNFSLLSILNYRKISSPTVWNKFDVHFAIVGVLCLKFNSLKQADRNFNRTL